jgi:5-methylcytosine-specific restriction protein A
LLLAWAELELGSSSLSGQDLIDELTFAKSMERRAEHHGLRATAQLDSDGVFVDRGMRTAPAVADLLRCTPLEARRLVAVAASVFPTSLTGEALEPRLPATATALGGWEIDRAHAEVIERLLGSAAALRLAPATWTGVEAQLADAARQYRLDELAHHGATLIELLDQDGPPPDDEDQLVYELRLSKSRTGGGGRIKGQLDAAAFDVLARAIRANLPPVEPDPLGRDKTLGERQAEALGAICEHALDDGFLPVEGGERPHISPIIDFEGQRRQARGARLEFGGMTTAAQPRRLLCDAKITPVVLGGEGQPLDVGREKRTVTPAQRKAIAARDRGCAYPGCDKTPSWCEVHHIIHWIHGGRTDIDNLVMLCRAHHNRNSFRQNGSITAKHLAATPGHS